VAEVSKFDGDIGSRTGSILASWFLFNPNWPTAYAFGYMEESERLRFFGCWMHFTGGETYLVDDLSQSEAASADFAERMFGAVVALNNHIAMSGDEPRPVPGANRLPDFVITNGNPPRRELLTQSDFHNQRRAVPWPLLARHADAGLGIPYAAGLHSRPLPCSTRISMRVESISSTLRCATRKDRNAMLSPQLQELLRLWWREGKRRGVMA
jgi:hypothetical protein